MTGSTESKRYLCVHGHFYQPPRENPWLEMVVYQKSARPYHDWNERVTRECYGPNARSRLLANENRIMRLMNNYNYMSFNFGPTLFSWLEEKEPWIYSEILKADETSLKRYGGHGNAIAQVYNHIIMPLASTRDKHTQIRWGISDFRHRFGRHPEGMWLAETAVDSETLRLMAEEGIKFTILSPAQAQSVRPLVSVSRPWQDVSGGRIDPTRPYRVLLGEGDASFIDVFFYDGPLSRAVAYENVLGSGEELLGRIREVFAGHENRSTLVSIATDGESYGHHFKFGEMALSWLFYHVEQDDEIRLTNYGQFLECFPPENEVRIIENSAWSCAHGLGRWQEDCGCSVSRRPGWNQKWRAPLREGLDRLSSQLSSLFETRAAGLLRDPWKARDDYIRIILDPAEDRVDEFMRHHLISPDHGKRTEILQLMESQRMALYMFTSCGWFFDDIAGIEASQVLMYAARAIDLVGEWSSGDLEKGLMKFLVQAESNDPEHGHGGKVYETMVKSSRITPSLAAAHHAMACMIRGEPLSRYRPFQQITSWTRKIDLGENGKRGMIGCIKIAEKRTGRVYQRGCLVLQGQGCELSCMVGSIPGNVLAPWLEEILEALRELTGEEVLVEFFSGHTQQSQRFILNDLIPDTRKYIINGLADNVDGLVKRSIEAHHASIRDLMQILQQTGEQPPPFIRRLFHILFFNEFYDLLRTYREKTDINLNDLLRLASLCDPSSCRTLDRSRMVKDMLRWQIDSFIKTKRPVYLENVMKVLTVFRNLNLEPDLWDIQNIFYDLYQDPQFKSTLEPALLAALKDLGRTLGFSIR